MNDYAELRAALEAVPCIKWTASRATVHIPDTEDWAGKDLSITGLDKQVSRKLARYIADTNPAVIRALLAERDALRVALEDELIWHEAQDKAISKQPNANAGHNWWRRMQHQEHVVVIRAVLGQEQEEV